MVFVCWDADLIPEKLSEPAEYPGAKEATRFSPIKPEDLITYFAGYNNRSLGRVKKLFLGWARALGPHCSQCQELNRLFSQCVDGNRIKIPDVLCDPPQPSPDTEPFILDVLHDSAAAHWENVKTNNTHIDVLDRETLVSILSSPNPLSEFELAKMTFTWCRKHHESFNEFWTFFTTANLTSDDQAWFLSELPPTARHAASVKNGLHQSNVLTRQELEAFRLDYHALHWKCVFDSTSDPLRSLMTVVNRTFECFTKKLLVLRTDERLSVAIYFPRPLKPGEDVQVDSSVRLFAFPHTHKNRSGHRRVVPTKQNYRFYYDAMVMQLYENHRSNTFLFFTHSAGDNTSYGDLVGTANRARARQKLIDDGVTCDWRVSIALQKFSSQLATQVGRTNRTPVTAAVSNYFLSSPLIYVQI
jgi:RNA dependent RNA polymerase